MLIQLIGMRPGRNLKVRREKRRVLSVVGDDGQILIDANGLTMS
jgi:hypothetical protein